MKRRDYMGVAGVIADANKILWQRGLTLVRTGPYHLINNTNLLDHTDVLNPANAKLAAMLDATNSMGSAVELYFVRKLEGGAIGGVRRSEGIAIAAIGNGHTIAHEVMHDCGLEDIYTVEDPGGSDPNPVSGPVSAERIPADWGGGYYPPGQTQRSLINRLIMRSGGYNEETTGLSLDLPRGSVWGYHNMVSNGVPVRVRVLGLSACGQGACTKTPGSH